MSIPKIDPYPPAPTPEDDEATFDEKAYEHAASLETRRVQMNEVATYVNTRASDANSRAVAAEASATASSNSAARADEWANKAPGSVVASGKYSARHYSDLSDKFANAPEDVEVEPGKYSALHWQEKAKKIANVHATTVATDPLPTVLATNVQEALRDLAYQSDQLRVAKNQLKYGDGPYPVLDLQFQGAKYLDPRVTFTRAAPDWDWDGKRYEVNEPVLTDEGLWVSRWRANLYPDANTTQGRILQNATLDSRYELGSGVIDKFNATEANGCVDFRMGTVQQGEISCQITLGKTDAAVKVKIYSGASGILVEATIDAQGGLVSVGGMQHKTARVTVTELLGHRLVKVEGVLSGEGSTLTRIRVESLDLGEFSAGRAQIEAGPTCTPFIPTEGSQVTVSTTQTLLAPISDTWEYNKKGSFVCKVVGRNFGVASTLINFGLDTEDSRPQYVYFSASSSAGFLSFFDGNNQVIPGAGFDFDSPITFGLQWDETRLSVYVDGAKARTVPWINKASNPTLELFKHFTFIPYALLFDKTLTDEEMETLTR